MEAEIHLAQLEELVEAEMVLVQVGLVAQERQTLAQVVVVHTMVVALLMQVVQVVQVLLF